MIELENNLNTRVKNFKKSFIILAEALETLRNYYTHFYHDPITFGDNKEPLLELLDEVLLKTILDVKKNI